MRRNLPKITTLQCFDAVSQHLNMTRAGKTLHMTQSAVSKQIKSLEEHMGRRLFERFDGELTLTPVGEQFAQEVREILARLDHVTEQFSVNPVHSHRYKLKVVTEPTMALRWLAPRINEFNALYPDIQVDLCTDFVAASRSMRRYDFAILFGDGHWEDCRSDFLRHEHLVAVASPRLMRNRHCSNDMHSVLELPFLHHDNPISTTTMWLCALGKTDAEIAQFKGSHYETLMLLYEVVKSGTGSSILPRYLVQKDIEDGTLVKVCQRELLLDKNYYLVYQQDRHNEYAIKNFRRWAQTHGERLSEVQRKDVEISAI